MFDPDADDERMDMIALTRLLVRETALPVIAAGGIMDGRGIAAALEAGASAAQLGTAFIASATKAWPMPAIAQRLPAPPRIPLK